MNASLRQKRSACRSIKHLHSAAAATCKPIEYGRPRENKHTLWIIHVKDSGYQRWCYAVGIAAEINANFEGEVAMDLG
jgi:hypothetical protein